jgi:hypothetical protein
MSSSLRLPGPFRSSAPRAIVAAAFVVLVAAVVVLSLLLVRTPSAAAPAPAPSHSLQMVSDECYEAGPATPC